MSDWSLWDKQVTFSELAGKTITEIEGMEVGSERVTFKCADGSEFLMYHSQDCCESVELESIVGEVSDLIGSPILKAEEATSDKDPEGYAVPEEQKDWYRESFTWTFYKLATNKGYVDIRWYGSSNGYYSEAVDFAKVA